jgi:hypothetical protein
MIYGIHLFEEMMKIKLLMWLGFSSYLTSISRVIQRGQSYAALRRNDEPTRQELLLSRSRKREEFGGEFIVELII